jgi:hypothetical protein
MRSSGSFHPEWGYLAPAPSFLRTCRTVLISTTVGLTAGAAVAVSLVGRPATERSVMVEPFVAASSQAPATVAQLPPTQTPAQQPTAAPPDTHPAAVAEKPEASRDSAAPQPAPAASDRVASAVLPDPAPLPVSRPTPVPDEAMHDAALATVPNQAGYATGQPPVHVARARKQPENIVPDRVQDSFQDLRGYQNYYDYYPRPGYSYQPSPYYRQW